MCHETPFFFSCKRVFFGSKLRKYTYQEAHLEHRQQLLSFTSEEAQLHHRLDNGLGQLVKDDNQIYYFM
jgi:hypothetical protein